MGEPALGPVARRAWPAPRLVNDFSHSSIHRFYRVRAYLLIFTVD